MWIMGQNEMSLFDLNRFSGVHIYKNGDKYNITGIDKFTGSDIDLAEYDSEDKAKEVLIDFISNIDKERYVMPLN